ncbi:unnamed protein product [Trypanosoma congolense IL3000]|uniref:WGS project CAEQ00000000 data, annotated contig 1977 n=1 Tax=Trypanosoma congolense (strain IL3000) TaxID=1068625 RepID=F9WAI4_TRYCI|nr:unnamed protein product [Trypanosoma congolense IL3000]
MSAAENIEKAKPEFAQVIFGDGGNESDLEHTALNGVGYRVTACGKPGQDTKGESAGNNLAVDFFCLCAQRQDGAGINQVCGFYVGSNRENGQLCRSGTRGPMGSSTMSASIKGCCGKHMQKHPKSTTEVRHILDQFLKHLKTGGVYRWGDSGDKVDGSKRKAAMLGAGVRKKNGSENGPVCDGKKGKSQSSVGVCVYYGTESDGKNISWAIKFETALARVDYVNNNTDSIQRALHKLQMLLHRAEQIYETAKVITEIQRPAVPKAFQNESVNLTAYNAMRTRSYSRRAYIIPLWALFLP